MEHFCFAMMPFGNGTEYEGKKEESDFIFYDIIKPSVEDAIKQYKDRLGKEIGHDLKVIRELENVAPGAITVSLVRHIAEAHIAIIDLTGRNPNVFLELGIRFALRRNGTILLVQNVDEIPFDVRHFRVVEYKPQYAGIAKAKTDLTAAILMTLDVIANSKTSLITDSLVFEALPHLQISGWESLKLESVNWDEYWSRTAQVCNVLGELQASGIYTPDIIVGISNGGLFLADTVLRLVYNNNLPLLALWARRSQEKFFDNPINHALINTELLSGLKQKSDAFPKTRLLVMDDIVGTQRTFRQLLEYFSDRLCENYENIEIRFAFLFTPREETLDELSEYLLSQDHNIATKYKPIELEAVTGKGDLPYRKSIHYGTTSKSKDKSVSAQ
jgi:hypoxanthine phosphoribosyltransferase